MRKILTFKTEDIIPDLHSVFELLQIPIESKDKTFLILFEEAAEIFQNLASVKSVYEDISPDDLSNVLSSIGKNHPEVPFVAIFNQSKSPALFAVTVGSQLTHKIADLFNHHDYAIASMLDAVASVGCEKVAGKLESLYHQHLKSNTLIDSAEVTLMFSPGYCGWHISAQQKLFELLKPEEIDITLNDSYLMIPLKSISGVFISGERDLFKIEDKYSFCTECKNHTCIDRYEKLFEN